MKKIQKGFTLIELMIVVAIIGILAAVAIPAYQDYIIKAKLSKVQSTLDSLKTAFAMYYQENSGFPNDAQTVAYPGDTPIAAGTVDVWTSIGLKRTPVLSKEIASMTYTAGTVVGVQAVSFGLDITLNNIKVGVAPTPTIDTVIVRIVPRGMDGSAIQWDYSCDRGASVPDPLLLKYLKRPGGGDCDTTILPIP